MRPASALEIAGRTHEARSVPRATRRADSGELLGFLGNDDGPAELTTNRCRPTTYTRYLVGKRVWEIAGSIRSVMSPGRSTYKRGVYEALIAPAVPANYAGTSCGGARCPALSASDSGIWARSDAELGGRLFTRVNYWSTAVQNRSTVLESEPLQW